MKKSQFKSFKETVIEAGKDAVVWYAGYLWLTLSRQQINIIYNILLTKPFLNESTFNSKVGIEIPSGLFILKEGSNNNEN